MDEVLSNALYSYLVSRMYIRGNLLSDRSPLTSIPLAKSIMFHSFTWTWIYETLKIFVSTSLSNDRKLWVKRKHGFEGNVPFKFFVCTMILVEE